MKRVKEEIKKERKQRDNQRTLKEKKRKKERIQRDNQGPSNQERKKSPEGQLKNP